MSVSLISFLIDCTIISRSSSVGGECYRAFPGTQFTKTKSIITKN